MATTEEGLRVRIGVPVAELRKDIAATKAAFSDLSKSVNQESSAVESANKSWNQMGKFILQVNYERRRMVQQINQGIGAWKLEAAAVNEAVEAARNATGQFVKVSGSIRDVKSTQEAFIKSAKEGSLAYHKLGIDIGFAGKATKDWIESYRRTGSAAAAISQETAKLSKSMDALRSKTSGAFGALSGFTNIIRDAPYGIIGIGNNITQLSDAFVILKQQTGSSRAAFSALISSVFSPSGLFTVALSSAVTLWTLYSQRQQKAASEAKKAADQFKSLSEIINDGNINLKQYTASALGEVSVLNKLFLIASDETRSRKDRTSALKELKKQTNGYLDSLTLETIKTDAARKSLDEFNRSLFNSAILKANQSYVEDLAKEWGKLARQGEEGKRRIAELDRQINQANQPGGDIGGETRFDRFVRLSKERNALVVETNKAIKEQNRLQDEILSTGTKIAELQTKVNPFTKTENKGSKGKTVQSVLNELDAELKSISLLAETTGAKFDSVAKDKISALQKAFEDLIKLGLKPTSPELKNIVNQINTLSSSIIGTKGIRGIQLFTKEDSKGLLTNEERILRLRAAIVSLKNTGVDPASESIKKLETEILALRSNTPLINVDNFRIVKGEVQAITPTLQSLGSEYAKFVAKTKAHSKDLADDFKRRYIVIGDALTGSLGPAIVNLQQLLQQGISNIAVGLGESIGNLITGKNGLASVFGGILGLMGDFIKEFGQSLITAGTLRIIAEKTLLANPYLAIAAGIAAVAAGTALKNKVPSFATGGVVTGPQLAMVGDNPGQQEYIIPSEIMDKLGASSSYPSEIVLRAHGADLVGVLRLGQNYNGRING